MKLHLVVMAVALGVGASMANAAVLIADNFTNSTGTNVNTVSDTEAVGVGQFDRILDGTSTMSVISASGIGSGNSLQFSNGTSNFYRAFDGAATTTLNSLSVGQTLSLSYDVRFASTPGAGAQNFSFGFVNQSSPNSIVYANIDLDGGVSEFNYRTGSFNMSDGGSNISTYATDALTSSTNYNFTFSVTKTTAGGDFQLQYFLNGVQKGSFTALSASTFSTTLKNATITGIAFRYSQTPGIATEIDNVSVTTSEVPEPASIASMGLLGLLAMARRRA